MVAIGLLQLRPCTKGRVNRCLLIFRNNSYTRAKRYQFEILINLIKVPEELN